MNSAHIHIVLNHVPSLGSIAGLLILAFGIHKKDESIKQFAFGVLVLITMAVLPTYVTGAEAQRMIAKNPTKAPPAAPPAQAVRNGRPSGRETP